MGLLSHELLFNFFKDKIVILKVKTETFKLKSLHFLKTTPIEYRWFMIPLDDAIESKWNHSPPKFLNLTIHIHFVYELIGPWAMTFAQNKKDFAQKLDVKQLPHPRDGRPEWALGHWWQRNMEAFRTGGWDEWVLKWWDETDLTFFTLFLHPTNPSFNILHQRQWSRVQGLLGQAEGKE